MDFLIYDISNPISETDFESIYCLLSDSLPQTEMRSKENQHRLLSDNRYKLLVAKDGEEINGFMAIWNLDKYFFIEHFAVNSSCRGNGIGGAMLDYCKELFSPVILEVEPPGSTPESARRIEFYKRHGFCFNDYEYYQPPLQEGFDLLPLKIMSYPHSLDDIKFKEAKYILYREVYGILKKDLIK